VKRVRVLGSLALALCQLAAGRLDAVASLQPTRAIDIAAAQLLIREAGFDLILSDAPEAFGEAPLDLAARSRVVAGVDRDACERLAELLPAASTMRA
jgi:myo-inositol-1(or 4)-monophosphatase